MEGTLANVTGTVTVRGVDGSERIAGNGDAIQEGEVVSTGFLSSVTVMFQNGCQMTLGADEEALVDETVYNLEMAATDEVVVENEEEVADEETEKHEEVASNDKLDIENLEETAAGDKQQQQQDDETLKVEIEETEEQTEESSEPIETKVVDNVTFESGSINKIESEDLNRPEETKPFSISEAAQQAILAAEKLTQSSQMAADSKESESEQAQRAMASAHNAAESAQTAAQIALEAIGTNIDTTKIAEAETAAKTALDAADSYLTDAESALTAANDYLSAALQVQTDAAEYLKAVESGYSLESTSSRMSRDLTANEEISPQEAALKAAQSALAAANAEVATAQAAVNAAAVALENAESLKADITELTDAIEAKTDAIVDAANQAAENASNIAAASQEAADEAENDNNPNDYLTAALQAQIDANAYLVAAQNAYDIATAANEDLTDESAMLQAAQAAVTVANAEVVSAQVAVESLDTVPPAVTVDTIELTNNPSPTISGTVDDSEATVVVTIGGEDYLAVNNGDGTWELNADVTLPEGENEIIVTVTDPAGNESTSIGQITVDTTAPIVGVNSIELTNDSSPVISGTVNDTEATVIVTIGGEEYTAVNNGDGTWTLDEEITLPDGENEIVVSVTDPSGNLSTSVGQIVVDSTAPNPPSIAEISDSGFTNDSTPVIEGIAEPGSSVQVMINGSVAADIAADENGEWSYSVDTLSDGEYTVTAVITDEAGNTSPVSSPVTFVVDTVPPAVAVNSIDLTNDNTTAITGTVDDAEASIIVSIGGTEYNAVNNGDGTWILAKDSIEPLEDGEYSVSVKAIDVAGNESSSVGYVNIDTNAAPIVENVDLGDFVVGGGSENVSVVFESENAAYKNVLGSYEVDENGNIINAQIIMSYSKGFGGHDSGELLGTIDNGGENTGLFLIADGYKAFGDLSNHEISFDTSGDHPVLLIDGEVASNHHYAGTFFSDASLNADGANHFNYEYADDGKEVTVKIEDLQGGGDSDFNDLVVKLQVENGTVGIGEDGTIETAGGVENVTFTDSDLLANAFDADGDTLSIESVSLKDPSTGTLEAEDGTYTFTPNEDYEGSVEIDFSVTDGEQSSSATASFDIGIGDVGETLIVQDGGDLNFDNLSNLERIDLSDSAYNIDRLSLEDVINASNDSKLEIVGDAEQVSSIGLSSDEWQVKTGDNGEAVTYDNGENVFTVYEGIDSGFELHVDQNIIINLES